MSGAARPGAPEVAAAGAPATEVPLLHQIGTRLTLLLLAVVLVLAAATGVLLWRAVDALVAAPGGAAAAVAPEALGAVLRSSLVNLAAVVAVTLVAAAAFSRSLLAEPIARLTDATRALAAGERDVRLRLTDRSELGELARAFDTMADALAEGQDRLEARVAARTAELRALLALSNTIAVTTDLDPLLAAVLDRLEASGAGAAAEVLELEPGGTPVRLAARGALAAAGPLDLATLPAAGTLDADGAVLTLPLRVRDRTLGALRVAAPADGAWDEERRRLATAVAAQAAVALENVRLYERARDEAADDERRHLARELHDSVSQALYAIVLGGHAAQKQLGRDPEKARRALDTVVDLAEAALAEMRALIFELRPEALADVGLVAALHRQLDGLELRHKLATDRALEAVPELPFTHQQALLRVVQEGLHNVVKHARAGRVAVRADADAGVLRLEVADDGVGFDPRGPFPGHLGLTSMRERLADLGGRLEVDSAPGRGTRLRALLPVASGAGGAAAPAPGGAP